MFWPALAGTGLFGQGASVPASRHWDRREPQPVSIAVVVVS
jgi:hypothetical protein